MSRDCVAFVAAPYGFGPSSKAIAISSHLPRSVPRTFLGDGPPLDMARRSKEFSSCVRLDFKTDEAHARELLAEYSVVVFVNTMRFLQAASNSCDAVIFVDTLAWLRTSQQLPSAPLSAYFAQRFFDYPFPTKLRAMRNFHAVGAIIPKTFFTSTCKADDVARYPRSPIVHCGGLFSPAMYEGANSTFANHVSETLKRVDKPLRVIAPEHMRGQIACNSTKHLSLVDCTPLTVSEHIVGSSVALTTSGIEFTYESMFLGVPTVFLPPFNISQHLQLQYHRRAFPSSIQFTFSADGVCAPLSSLDQETATLQTNGILGRWTGQFEAIGHFLDRVLSGNADAELDALRHAQTESVNRVGNDGAQTIASCVMHNLIQHEGVECAYRST
jgi:hypothetical protein